MSYINTTQLRYHTKDLVTKLSQGQSLVVLHRSKAIGKIVPFIDDNYVIFNADKAEEVTKNLQLNLPRDYKKRSSLYSTELEKKYQL